MRRIKSAPANIAEMVNRKSPVLEKNKKTLQNIIPIIPIKKNNNPIIMKQQINNLKNQKNIEKTFNNIMLDYINDKDFYNINDEEALFISITYFYICEKIFTKSNIREFILFIIQMFIRYIFTHTLHEIYINNIELITNTKSTNNIEILHNKLLLLQHHIHI